MPITCAWCLSPNYKDAWLTNEMYTLLTHSCFSLKLLHIFVSLVKGQHSCSQTIIAGHCRLIKVLG